MQYAQRLLKFSRMVFLSAFLAAMTLSGDALASTSVSIVSFTFSDTVVLDPSGPPASEAGISSMKISFKVKIDKGESTSFTYDATKWIVGFQNASGSGEIVEHGTTTSIGTKSSTIAGNVETVDVELQVTFSSGGLSDSINDLIDSVEKSSGRRSLVVVPIYRPGKDKTDQKVGGKNYLWAADVGVIQGAATMLKPIISDESIILRWRKPTDLTALEPKQEVLTASGTSTVSGYLILYWNLDDCAANESGWAFRGNPTLDSETSGGREFTCSFSGSTAASREGELTSSKCSFGCDTSPVTGFSGKNLEEGSVPFVLPDYGDAGTLFSSGCYKLVRINGTGAKSETYALSDLKNGDRYGAVVYPLDSSGHVGLERSACAFGTPVKFPLPGEGKGGAKRSDSDCFVVTAASGDSSSQVVQTWRLIRDHLLGRGAFTTWYYKSGPNMARWLDAHPWLKDVSRSVLETIGDAIWTLRDTWRDLTMNWNNFWRKTLALSGSLLVSEAYAVESPSEVAAQTSVGSNLQMLGGLIDFTEETKPWNAYLKLGGKATKPYRLYLGYNFSMWENPFGELGLGAGFTYLSAIGEIPKRLPNGTQPGAAAVGQDIVTYAYGGYGTLDYRLKIPYFPWLSPRVLVGGGLERVRTEARSKVDPSTTNEMIFPRGITVNKKMMLTRAQIELYLSSIFTEEVSSARLGLGLQDMALTAFYDVHKDYSSDKGISVSDTTIGGGFSFLFL